MLNSLTAEGGMMITRVVLLGLAAMLIGVAPQPAGAAPWTRG
jgi:hypothetical protein